MTGSIRWGGLLLTLPVLVAFVSFLAVACGGDDNEKEENSQPAAEEEHAGEEGELFVDPDAPVVDAKLVEWSISLSPDGAQAGAVTFSAANQGGGEHELVIIKTDTPADKLVATNGKVDEDTAGEMIGEIEKFAAGKTVAGTFDLAPGHYALICNIEGHYEQGMHADLTVE